VILCVLLMCLNCGVLMLSWCSRVYVLVLLFEWWIVFGFEMRIGIGKWLMCFESFLRLNDDCGRIVLMFFCSVICRIVLGNVGLVLLGMMWNVL